LLKEGEGSRVMLLGNRTSVSPGLLYLVQDQAFVSNAAPAVSNAARILAKMQESAKVRWKIFQTGWRESAQSEKDAECSLRSGYW
jgi:hypothetical protein